MQQLNINFSINIPDEYIIIKKVELEKLKEQNPISINWPHNQQEEISEIDTSRKHDRLYVARREGRLKQTEVAKMLNITNVTYSKKEKGNAEFTLTEAKILSKFFGYTLDELFG